MASNLASDGHLSIDAISRFLHGDTDLLNDPDVKAHMAGCTLCSDLIRDLGTLVERSNAKAC